MVFGDLHAEAAELVTADGCEAARVESAVAWMFGMSPAPQLPSSKASDG
ncbi:hypothetical protein [Pseudonocardia asaccharolytica]|nr:hypothetical protein [Pseudonocardia asaccharolytica]